MNHYSVRHELIGHQKEIKVPCKWDEPVVGCKMVCNGAEF